MKSEIIAEIGSNWEGDLNIAKKIIKKCKQAGADGVKFQMWRAGDLYKKSHPDWKVILKSELTFEKSQKAGKIFQIKKELSFFVVPFIQKPVTLSRKNKGQKIQNCFKNMFVQRPKDF